MEMESYSICKPIKGLCKSYGLWANSGNSTAPLVYFTKPKWIKEETFIKIVNSIRLELNGDDLNGEM